MKTLFASAFVAVATVASPAFAEQRLPFGAPSEPTVFGHRIETTTAPVLQRLMTVRQARPSPAIAGGRQPSEPTIWGHRLPDNDPRRFPAAE